MYLHDWSETGLEGMLRDFELNAADFIGVDVLFATYTYENYSGNAFVLFEKEGKLYEVNGGHCSCYGLEGQWLPEETTIKDLERRLYEGRLGVRYDDENEFAEELKGTVNKLKLGGNHQ